jgi:hypothetical protein
MSKHSIAKPLIGFLSLALFCCAPLAPAQSADQGGSAQSAAKPADSPGKASASTTTEKKKPKKVWTNDEIGSVKGGISVVGDESAPSSSAPQKQPASNSDQARKQQIDSYRERIQSYQAQIDAIDQRIAQLKSFKADNTAPSGGIDLHQSYDMVPTEDQVKQLEEEKKKLQAKLDDTEAEARKNGVEPGELR